MAESTLQRLVRSSIAGESGWNVVQETLSFEEPSDLFAAGSLAFESGNRDWIDFVLELLGKKPEVISKAISALGWLPYEKAQPHIQTLVSSPLSISQQPLLPLIHARGS